MAVSGTGNPGREKGRLEAARELWVIGFARATTNQTVFDDFRIKFTVLCEMTSVLN